jgi:hypothetical protein
MLVNLQREIADDEAQVARMDDAAKRDQDKLCRLEAGEDIPVKELDYAALRAILKSEGTEKKGAGCGFLASSHLVSARSEVRAAASSTS